jgi:DNA-binding IclR family transcriptional regulator
VPRPSPQTDRVVAVIELLAAREAVEGAVAGSGPDPGGATMTEIARALRINQATCVHLLAALTAAGFVVREPADRRYHLGPALVRPGRLAAARYPLLAAARDEMTGLAGEFGVPCFAFAPEVDHARLVHYTWPPGEAPPAIKLGETVPLTPPLGILFVTWATDADFDAWLALDPALDNAGAASYREQRVAIRSLGFVVEVAARADDLAHVLDDRPSPYRDGQLHRLLAADGGEAYLLTDLDDPRPRLVTGIGAPIFDAAGAAVLSLNLVTFADPLGPAEIARIGRALRAAADRVTEALVPSTR